MCAHIRWIHRIAICIEPCPLGCNAVVYRRSKAGRPPLRETLDQFKLHVQTGSDVLGLLTSLTKLDIPGFTPSVESLDMAALLEEVASLVRPHVTKDVAVVVEAGKIGTVVAARPFLKQVRFRPRLLNDD